MTARTARHVSLVIAVVVMLALIPAAFAARGGGGGSTGGSTSSGCSIAPGTVALDQVWTVSAWGLPNTTNMILTFPDGATSTGPVTVSGGRFSTTGNSNMSASWGFINPEQTGTYHYTFVGRVKWPAGTYSQTYASCSVVVS